MASSWVHTCRYFAVLAALVFGAMACDSGSGSGVIDPQAGTFINPAPCGTDPDINTESEAASWQCIGPSGGEVLVPGPEGHKLVVPQGALSENVRLTIKRHHNIHDTSLYLWFEPEGLVFSTPVTLRVVHGTPPDGEAPLLSAAYYGSALHETVDLGTELTNWVPAKVVGYDEAERAWSIELEHFSTFNAIIGVNELGYVVVDTHKYTRPGDILFALTTPGDDPPSWNTGHVGMFSGVYPYMGTEVTPVAIESTSGGAGGVRSIAHSTFQIGAHHIYVGARRPKGNLLTDAERTTVLTYAHTQRRNQAGYSIAGFGAFGNFSCVGLVEESLDEVDRGVLGYAGEFFGGTPYGMWEETVPVEDVVVSALEDVDIPVYSVRVATTGLLFYSINGGYERSAAPITHTGLPDGASFDFNDEDGAYHLTWKPTVAQIGQAYQVTFDTSGTFHAAASRYEYAATRPINLKVSGIQHEFTVMPNTTTVQGYTYIFYTPAPQTAEFRSWSLIDVETNTPAEDNVFPNHTFEVHHQGWSAEYPGKYGITFQVRNPSGVPVAVSPRVWRYTVDHSSGFWNGDLEAE